MLEKQNNLLRQRPRALKSHSHNNISCKPLSSSEFSILFSASAHLHDKSLNQKKCVFYSDATLPWTFFFHSVLWSLRAVRHHIVIIIMTELSYK